jgi:hypothetical protein
MMLVPSLLVILNMDSSPLLLNVMIMMLAQPIIVTVERVVFTMKSPAMTTMHVLKILAIMILGVSIL